MNILQVEARIRAAVEAQKAKGVRIVAKRFGTHADCCPIQCVANEDANDGATVFESAGRVLEVGPEWLRGFIRGFDGRGAASTNEHEAYALGEKLRAEYLP